jgi:hypothetical protein
LSFLIDPFRVVPFYPAASLSYIATKQGPTLATVTTINGVDIGTEAENRRVIAVIYRASSPAVALLSATIAGIDATIDSDEPDTGNGLVIISADVPTGTTATVVLTFESVSTAGDTYIGTYAAYGLKDAAPVDVVHVDGSTELPFPTSDTVAVKAGGVLVCGSLCGSLHEDITMGNPSYDYRSTLAFSGVFYSVLLMGGMETDTDEDAHEVTIAGSDPPSWTRVFASYR